MNTQIIPVFTGEISNTSQPLCDARVLYSFLEVKQQFGNWIYNRIKQYQFIENIDFCSFNKIIKRTSRGSTTLTEYHLTFDMAKELAMVERNAKGREARRYFIECERRLHQGLQPANDTAMHTLQAENAELLGYNEQLQADIDELLAHSQTLQHKYTDILEYKVAQLEQQSQPRKRKPSRPLTENDINAINALHEQGISNTQIAKKTGFSGATVSYVVRSKEGKL